MPDEPVWVEGKFGLLHCAVLNLILNAGMMRPHGPVAVEREPGTYTHFRLRVLRVPVAS